MKEYNIDRKIIEYLELFNRKLLKRKNRLYFVLLELLLKMTKAVQQDEKNFSYAQNFCSGPRPDIYTDS